MTTAEERKTMQVSPGVHAAVHELATRLGTSADGVLRYLLDPYTIRVQVSEAQRDRWAVAAVKEGLALPQWVSHRIEAGLTHDPAQDRETLNQIFYRVKALCGAAGLPEPGPARRTLKEKH